MPVDPLDVLGAEAPASGGFPSRSTVRCFTWNIAAWSALPYSN